MHPALTSKGFYTPRQAAGWLGTSVDTLRRLAADHALYEVDSRGFPGSRHGHQCYGYHVRHLELIAAARLGAVDPDEALLRWQIEMARMAEARANSGDFNL